MLALDMLNDVQCRCVSCGRIASVGPLENPRWTCYSCGRINDRAVSERLHDAWLACSPKMREMLVHLKDGPKTAVPFASGTIKALVTSGLVRKVRVDSIHTKSGKATGYELTESGMREVS